MKTVIPCISTFNSEFEKMYYLTVQKKQSLESGVWPYPTPPTYCTKSRLTKKTISITEATELNSAEVFRAPEHISERIVKETTLLSTASSL